METRWSMTVCSVCCRMQAGFVSWVSVLIDCSVDTSEETVLNTIKWEVGSEYSCVLFSH